MDRGPHFRPDIEGLRAVAIGAVLLYHAGVPGATGGFVGVDVFFVISGFLITGLLIREWSGRGTIDLPSLLRSPLPPAPAGRAPGHRGHDGRRPGRCSRACASPRWPATPPRQRSTSRTCASPRTPSTTSAPRSRRPRCCTSGRSGSRSSSTCSGRSSSWSPCVSCRFRASGGSSLPWSSSPSPRASRGRTSRHPGPSSPYPPGRGSWASARSWPSVSSACPNGVPRGSGR